MDHPTSEPAITDDRTLVRADLGGWLSGPCLAADLPPEAAQPPVLRTVITVARLRQELPNWGVAETSAFQLISVTPSGAPISELPLALIPTAAVPLLLALHITSVSALVKTRRAPRPATAPLAATAR